MSLQDDVKTVLTGNTTLVGLFTGGIITFDDLGGLGFNRKSYPTAWETVNGVAFRLRPTLIIRERIVIMTPTITDEALQYRSQAQQLEIWYFNDRAGGVAPLDQGQDIVYALLHDRNTGGARLMLRDELRRERDATLDFACYANSIFDSMKVRTPVTLT